MTAQPSIQYGLITYYDSTNHSGIIRSGNNHYFFNATTIIPSENHTLKNQKVAFLCESSETKKVVFLTISENIKAESEKVQKLIENLTFPNHDAPSTAQSANKEPTSIANSIAAFSALEQKFKMIIYISAIYTTTIIILIFRLERFSGLSLPSIILLVGACFLGLIILTEKLELTLFTYLFICYASITPLITVAGYEIAKMSQIAFINLDTIAEKTVLDHGIININFRETRGSKTHRSWNDLELHKHPTSKVVLFCDFINPEDTCPKFEYLDKRQVYIQYVLLQPYEALVLAIKASDHEVQYRNMIKNYKYQQQTIRLWFFFILFPSVVYPVLLISCLYWHKIKIKQS